VSSARIAAGGAALAPAEGVEPLFEARHLLLEALDLRLQLAEIGETDGGAASIALGGVGRGGHDGARDQGGHEARGGQAKSLFMSGPPWPFSAAAKTHYSTQRPWQRRGSNSGARGRPIAFGPILAEGSP
jgi:hypothetical protein